MNIIVFVSSIFILILIPFRKSLLKIDVVPVDAEDMIGTNIKFEKGDYLDELE